MEIDFDSVADALYVTVAAAPALMAKKAKECALAFVLLLRPQGLRGMSQLPDWLR